MNPSRPSFIPGFLPWAALAGLRPPGTDTPAVFPGLYVCGSLRALERPCVAIVGTRAASSAGKELARRTASELAAVGLGIISGLALGIDAAAHEGALEAGGPTIGILGGGHAKFFPPRNAALGERITASGGAVCSPFAPDEEAKPFRFLQRNGVVAALADAVVVVEAPARSGALNTAGWAAGRLPVFVFPGDVERRNVAGCLALLRDGATLVRNAADILADLGIDTAPAQQLRIAEAAHAGAEHAQILEALAVEPMSADQLSAVTGLPAPKLLAVLTELELGGVVSRREGALFARSPAG